MADRLPGLQRILNRVEVALARRFGWSIISVLAATPVLVIETVGRRSGRPRSTVVAFGRFPDPAEASAAGEVLVVVGGAAGKQRVPDWVANIRACPAVTVTIGGVRSGVQFRELGGVERSMLWPTLVATWPRIEHYEQLAGRLIPVFVVRFAHLPSCSLALSTSPLDGA